MTVADLIRLLEREDSTLHVAVGDYKGPHAPLGWNETHERSHGPIWVGEQEGRCFIGINCYTNKPETYRTVKDGEVVTAPEYYRRLFK